MDEEFNSIAELYERLKPALISKVMEIKSKGITYVKDVDVWNYLKENKWIHAKNLLIADMVDDILGCDYHQIESYVLKELSKLQRNADLSE